MSGLARPNFKTEIAAGEVATYQIEIRNYSLAPAHDIVVTEIVPLNATFDAAASVTPWSCPDGSPGGTACTYTFSVPLLTYIPALDLPKFGLWFAVCVNDSFSAEVDAVTNTVTASDDGRNGPDPDQSNNTAQDVDTIHGTPDLMVVKRASDTEGVLVASHLDVVASAGANTAYDLSFNATVNDGVLNVDLMKERGNPALNSIAVIPLWCAGP